jgi:hypothetical protein
LLGGGIISQITVLDLNILSSIAGYGNLGDIDGVIPFRELSDLSHLSALCARHELSVLAPSMLPSAEAPALTLDREGLLAVYVGRAPCALPGKDISIFRPIKRVEETIDVSLNSWRTIPSFVIVRVHAVWQNPASLGTLYSWKQLTEAC